MYDHIHAWFEFTRTAEPWYGVPLILFGLLLMFMGWQFNKAATPLIFILSGLVIGQVLFADLTVRLAAGICIGIIFALASHFFRTYAVAVLAGLAGAFVLSSYVSLFQQLYMPAVAYWGIAGVGFAGGAALGFITHRETVICLTSFSGSMLLILGLNTLMPLSLPTLYLTIANFLADYPGLSTPFLVGGPTFIGVMVQLAQADRSDAGVA